MNFAKNPDAQGNGLRLLTVTANNEGDTSSFTDNIRRASENILLSVR